MSIVNLQSAYKLIYNPSIDVSPGEHASVKLPKSENAQVPSAKLKGYLLSESHPVGKSKAKFFLTAGFNESNSELLEEGLLRIARFEDVKEVIHTSYGVKYVIDGVIQTPYNEILEIRTVWIIEEVENYPSLVTAYPR